VLTLVAGHAAGAVVAPYLLRRLGARAFLLLALVPAAAFVWTSLQTGGISDGEVLRSSVRWVPSLDLRITFVMGTLQWVLALLVTGIGALVLAYCAWYFEDDDPGVPSFGGHLLAFAGAMLGLVLAGDLLLMYVFWELTTVLSFLLIGYDPGSRASRSAAMQALIVTTLGGLAMLVGILLLHGATGTLQIEALLADPPTGTAVTVAVSLLLLGAVTKSAIVPFHFWLPGAMAAPTPVSAYLHAAAMVKAGIFLVALMAPAFADVAPWRPVLLALGVATMIVGGWRSLRQHDIKLLLAYGTVAQLGFLTVVAAAGTRSAAFAALAMLAAHALFKGCLFLVVGIVDHSAGTRDLRELSGVGRAMPVLAVVAALAGASMAGVPPLLGFAAKESVLTALTDLASKGEGTGLGPLAGWLVALGVTVGSALTVAYTARFLWGTFATKPGAEPSRTHRVRPGFLAAPVLLAGASLVAGVTGGPLTGLLSPYAEQFPEGAHEPYLALWHGIGPPLGLSLASLAGGALLFALRSRVQALQTRVAVPLGAQDAYVASVRGLDRGAVEVTARAQRGSLPIYLGVILAVVIVVPGGAALAGLTGLTGLRAGELRWTWWETPAQAAIGSVVAVAAVLTVRSRRRLRAVILLGVTGYGTALLFQLHGAPDLALTQVLVETVTVVVFVLVLRRLPGLFTDRPLQRNRYWRVAIGVGSGAMAAGLMLLTVSARRAAPVSEAFGREAVDYGGGQNVVNVTLVDIRAWDTLGELAVLVAAATGVASLIFIQTRGGALRRVRDMARDVPPDHPVRTRTATWLPGGRTMAPERRSIIIEVVTRLLFHTMVVFSLYLLFAGHNHPGGGFAAGLVTGLALVVRYLAGGRHELDEAAPVDAGALIGTGLAIAAGSALAPLAFGASVLESGIFEFSVPVLGDVKLVTSLGFDIGVFLVVVGLVLDLMRCLGSEIDEHLAQEREQKLQAHEPLAAHEARTAMGGGS
jgi:multicomponent Na+:H+ antiporter subunit A